MKMYGVKYYYRDQFCHDERNYPVIFTTRYKANKFIKKQGVIACYLKVITLEVDPQ